ncbi:MAG: radical SAM protein, partial [Chloroflexi bacterium]|nr:radical SAM protein [Chloroflexota bacterium]
MSAVYIHIPFCKHRCYYCDFITYANKNDMLPDYLEALQAEILSTPFNLGEAESIYIGGGTPSLMSSEQVCAVLQTVQKRFGIALGAEITLEVNPGTVKNNYYAQLKAVGINRLSMGLQSFVDEEL